MPVVIHLSAKSATRTNDRQVSEMPVFRSLCSLRAEILRHDTIVSIQNSEMKLFFEGH
jgi:hypothetical protein